jgi:hypothetical protein
MDWSVPAQRDYAIWTAIVVTLWMFVLRLPQFCAVLLLLLSVAVIVVSATRHKLRSLRTYMPVAVFAVFCLLVSVAIPTRAEASIRNKLADPRGGETWCRGMARRVLGGWPTTPHCALNDQVAAVIWYWSFVTLDGRMPVLIWSEFGMPDSELPTRPTACEHIDGRWFFCYLAEPGQLVYDHSGLCFLSDE